MAKKIIQNFTLPNVLFSFPQSMSGGSLPSPKIRTLVDITPTTILSNRYHQDQHYVQQRRVHRNAQSLDNPKTRYTSRKARYLRLQRQQPSFHSWLLRPAHRTSEIHIQRERKDAPGKLHRRRPHRQHQPHQSVPPIWHTEQRQHLPILHHAATHRRQQHETARAVGREDCLPTTRAPCSPAPRP